MKRLIVTVLMTGLLGLLGCRIGGVPRDVADPNNVFKLGIAKTPTHFYGVCVEGEPEDWWEILYRVPLDNIAQKEEIPLPQKLGEYRLRQVWIRGISANWLFVGCNYIKVVNDFQYAFYCVSLETGEVKTVATGDVAEIPRYNATSNSLLYKHGAPKEIGIYFMVSPFFNLDPIDEGESFQIEALQLDTGKRLTLYNGRNSQLGNWGFTYDGMPYFEIRDQRELGADIYAVVDKFNRIVPMTSETILFEYSCKDTQRIQCGDQALALEYHHDGDDGVELQLLDADGNFVKTILRAYTADSISYGLAYCFNGLHMPDNLIMMVEYVGDYDYNGSLYAIYDTNTGAVFSYELSDSLP